MENSCSFLAMLIIWSEVISFLPISEIYFEIAAFDIQKIKNPEIESTQYQTGSLFGYENVKAYLFSRERGLCQLCQKKPTKGNPFKVHHIIPRKAGGTDKPDNLALLHEECHIKMHRKNKTHLLKKNKQFKPETFMSSVRWKLFKNLKTLKIPLQLCYGYSTKLKRHKLNLEKDHHTDAFVIAGGEDQPRAKICLFLQKRKNNRTLQLNRKGFKPAIRKQRYKFQPKDLIEIKKQKYEVMGMFNKGTWIRAKNKNGTRNFPVKLIGKHIFTNTWQFIPSLKEGVFLPIN